jgi:S-formylglutathione hydrolase FrmB
MDIDSISVIDGWFPTVVIVLTIVTLLASLGWRATRTRRRRRSPSSGEWSTPEVRRRPAWRWQLLLGIPIAIALVGLAALIDDGVSLIPYQFPNSFYVWFALIPLALAFCAIGWRGAPWWRRAISVISVALACVFALTFVNQHYEYYPNVGALLGKEAQYQVSDAQLTQAQADYRKTKKLPNHGFTISEAIPGTESGFHGRTAYIWLPPVWVKSPTPKLPVVELLHGSPGAPEDWTRAGFADQTAQAYALSNDGKAPILVMPDVNGSELGDTECVDSSLGRVETYLTVDVPAYLRKTFHTTDAAQSIAVAGNSAGGMCAVMLTLRHPDIYTAFGDYAGLTSPTVSLGVDPAKTTAALFGGNSTEYNEHDPLWLLKNKKFSDIAGWFESGLSDSDPLASQRTLVPLARAAGVLTCAKEIPGIHDYTFAAQAFKDSYPWLSYRLKTGPEPPNAVTICSP